MAVKSTKNHDPSSQVFVKFRQTMSRNPKLQMMGTSNLLHLELNKKGSIHLKRGNRTHEAGVRIVSVPVSGNLNRISQI